MAGYFDELAQVRKSFDSRYDDIKSGKVKLIPGDEAYARLMESFPVKLVLYEIGESLGADSPDSSKRVLASWPRF
jgi:hypothetical protein